MYGIIDMYTEIERKFLLLHDDWRHEATSCLLHQGYIYSTTQCLVRIRIADEDAFLTVKGPKDGIRRVEFEYPIPLKDAEELLEHMARKPTIQKRRHKVHVGEHVWEIDEFLDDNAGLILAEIELKHEDEVFHKPSWVGVEVTDDPRYRHNFLAQHPYTQWSHAEKRV